MINQSVQPVDNVRKADFSFYQPDWGVSTLPCGKNTIKRLRVYMMSLKWFALYCAFDRFSSIKILLWTSFWYAMSTGKLAVTLSGKKGVPFIRSSPRKFPIFQVDSESGVLMVEVLHLQYTVLYCTPIVRMWEPISHATQSENTSFALSFATKSFVRKERRGKKRITNKGLLVSV